MREPVRYDDNVDSELLSYLKNQFGSYEAFIRKFAEIGSKHFGSGWLWLIYNEDKIEIISTSNEQNPLFDQNKEPILTCDLWEHAYYLQYQSNRKEYLENFCLHLINWPFADKNFKSVCK